LLLKHSSHNRQSSFHHILYPYSLPPSLTLPFYRPLHLRAIHSFPTRRSSDLFDVASPLSSDFWGIPFERFRRKKSKEEDVELRRSEEHTSELQSRFELVCRLLLEKKK